MAYGDGIPVNLKNSIFACFQLPFFLICFLISALSKSKKSDIIHSHWIPHGLIGLLVGKITTKPTNVTVHRLVAKKGLFGFINKIVLNHSDFIIYNSSYTLKEGSSFIKNKKFRIIPPCHSFNKIGIDRNFKKKLTSSLGISNKSKLLFFLAGTM